VTIFSSAGSWTTSGSVFSSPELPALPSRRCGQAETTGVDALLDRLAKVGPHVVAISDLLGLRCSDARTFCVTAGPVPANDLHLGVASEPGGQVLALAAVVEMQRTVGGHVDQHGAVMAALAEGEVVDAEHLDLTDVRLGQGPDQAQEGVLADGDADRGRQAGSCRRTRERGSGKIFVAGDHLGEMVGWSA
jgi:hypothetical protein